MITHIHKDFKKETEPLLFNETNERIREFAEWASEQLPGHVTSTTLVIDRSGFIVINSIVSNGEKGV